MKAVLLQLSQTAVTGAGAGKTGGERVLELLFSGTSQPATEGRLADISKCYTRDGRSSKPLLPAGREAFPLLGCFGF